MEAGSTTASPANFTATYTSAATSGSVSDGTNTSTLTPPNASSQSGSLAHTYCTVGQGITTISFTATAIAATTQTSVLGITCTFRTFSGAGTASATGATASGASAVLAGATGTLASAGLGNQGSYSCTASGQKCYVLMQGGSHTFTSGGFSFPMNTPTAVTFVNVNGVSVPLYLYESTNVLSGTFPLVAN